MYLTLSVRYPPIRVPETLQVRAWYHSWESRSPGERGTIPLKPSQNGTGHKPPGRPLLLSQPWSQRADIRSFCNLGDLFIHHCNSAQNPVFQGLACFYKKQQTASGQAVPPLPSCRRAARPCFSTRQSTVGSVGVLEPAQHV